MVGWTLKQTGLTKMELAKRVKKLKDAGWTDFRIANLYGCASATANLYARAGAAQTATVGRCALCDVYGESLHRHHISYVKNKTVLLCNCCHRSVHSDNPSIHVPDELKNVSTLRRQRRRAKQLNNRQAA